MKVLWPFGTASRGVVSNHHMLRRLNTVRGERCGKGALEVSGGDQEGERKRIADDVSLYGKVASEPGRILSPGMSLAGTRLLARRCPAWRRREPGLRLAHGTWEGVPRYACSSQGRGEGVSRRLQPEGIEYRGGVRRRTGS